MLGVEPGWPGSPGLLPMLGTVAGEGGEPALPMLGVEPGWAGAPGRLPMLGTVGGDCGAPGRLPMLGTVTGGGGHTADGGTVAWARRNAATVSPAKSMQTVSSNPDATGV